MIRNFIVSILYITTIFSLNIMLSGQCHSLEKETHKALNEHVARTSINNFQLNSYIISQLGVEDGIENSLNGKEIWKWLRDGGQYEDEPIYTRSFNHFHDPLEAWDNAGLYGTFQSSVLWAQDQGAFGSMWGGNYSWKAVREYFYIALTGKDSSGNIIAPTQTEKETYFGKTFRGIGQIMHLVGDASVPAHTRNDAHVIGYHYELAVDKLRMNNDEIFLTALANPVSFNPSILEQAANPLALIPIAKIFDTDLYSDTAPDPTVTASTSIGLSEYTNANFVSEGLLEANFNEYPYPRTEDTTTTEKLSPSGTYMRQYYLKACCGETNGGAGYLLSAVDYLDYWRLQYPALSIGLPKIPVLDDNVYKDYASLLIPRAVGYSAGLLNYFFRGKINIVQTGTDSFQIVNLSDEDMEGDLGSFKLYYDDTSDNRLEIPLDFIDSTGTPYTDPLTLLSIPSQAKSVFSVRLQNSPQNPKTPGQYMLVFRGKLGNEGIAPFDTDYAVAAQMITPHFLAHVQENSQWDVYEYDILGNRIFNLTGHLARGVPYYQGIPSPVNPDQFMYMADSGCVQGTDCAHLMTKSSGQTDNLAKSGLFWWSGDGMSIYALRDGYYDISAGSWFSSPWIITDACMYGGFFYPPKFSNDGTKIVIEALDPYGTEEDYDVLIYTNSVLSHIVDMNTNSLVPLTQPTDCAPYGGDEAFRDSAPDYHPLNDEVLFSSNADGTYDQNYSEIVPYDIFQADVGTGNIQKLTNAISGDRGYYEATWSPDGQLILMVGEKLGEKPEIYLIPAIGGAPTQITFEGVKHYSPRWIKYLGQ